MTASPPKPIPFANDPQTVGTACNAVPVSSKTTASSFAEQQLTGPHLQTGAPEQAQGCDAGWA